jgi:pyridoxamine 5'-phosphate oxidase family protein
VRALALLLAVVVVLALLYFGYLAVSASARRPGLRERDRARWRLRHYGDRGTTVVAVSLVSPVTGHVFDEHVVARIPDNDPDWSRRFLLAKEEAEERAFHLNADGTELPPA